MYNSRTIIINRILIIFNFDIPLLFKIKLYNLETPNFKTEFNRKIIIFRIELIY